MSSIKSMAYFDADLKNEDTSRGFDIRFYDSGTAYNIIRRSATEQLWFHETGVPLRYISYNAGDDCYMAWWDSDGKLVAEVKDSITEIGKKLTNLERKLYLKE